MRLRLLRSVYLISLLPMAVVCIAPDRCGAQSAVPTLTVEADAQGKVYGAPDPAFTYSYQGFTNGDTASVLSGLPALTAPQRVRNLWEFTESFPSTFYSFWQFSTDGTTQQSNGVQLSHIASAGNFYSSVSSPLTSLPAPVVIPGMQYLLSFYAVSNVNSYQVYWHRYLATSNVTGWGPNAIEPNLRRVIFKCAGTVDGALDCGNDPTVPIGSGPDQTTVYWLFLGHDNALSGDPSLPGFLEDVPADLYIGGFQMEPSVTEKRGVIVMGDSLTQYDCSTDDSLACTSWTAFAASQLDVPFYNRGIQGQTCPQVEARWATDASPILAANARYAIIFCGTNDIGLGYSAAQIEQAISAMSSLAIADGATPVIATIPPSSTTASNAESTRQAVNAWIRATYPLLMLDFDHVIADPNNPTQQNPAYVGDGTHLNFAGRVAEGNYVSQSDVGNTNGFPAIWSFHSPVLYQPVLGQNPSNGMDFHGGTQREAGSYIILPAAGSLASSKYNFAFSSALLNVSPAALSVSANNKTMTYGAALPTLDGTISGAVPADNISATYSTGATNTNNPGTYSIIATLVDPGKRLPNYAVTQNSGTLTIVPAASAAPTFTVAPGTYASPPTISILDSTPGAVIHYTTDGSTPFSNSPLYAGPIAVPDTETIQAIATALPDYSASPVASASYTVVPVITGLSPAYTSAGSSPFSVTVSGTGFNPNSTVHWGGTALVTQFVSPVTLSAQLLAPAIATSGISSVTVQDAANTSNQFQFEVDSSGASAYAPVFNPAAATVAAGATATYPVILPATATNVSVSCLNLPANATCAWSSAARAVSIATTASTLPGTYRIVIIFTETVPAAASALVLFPFLLLPFARSRKHGRSQGLLTRALIMVVVAAVIASLDGCGGNSPAPTQQVMSSGVVVLNVQ